MARLHPSTPSTSSSPAAVEPKRVGPPTKHQLALMIWVAVFPTLTLLNLTIGPLLKDSNPVLRTFVLATVAVPIVIYGVMPRLHRVRARILSRGARSKRM
jgi:antibiotic biosynthesis monooxygenase (ABM) superfamily enzyme